MGRSKTKSTRSQNIHCVKFTSNSLTFVSPRYGGGYDLAARRKNATRESTATLKAWLNEHKKNPYPTKGEKIMLAIITKMTLTQVSRPPCSTAFPLDLEYWLRQNTSHSY